MMRRLQDRLDRAADIQEETMKFTRKALKELTGFSSDTQKTFSQVVTSPSCENNASEQIIYNGKNIAALGGDSPAAITRNIAQALFTQEELAKVIIDSKQVKKADKERQPADSHRSELYRKATKIALGTLYTPDLYRKTLRLVNQCGVDTKNRSHREKVLCPSDQENDPSLG